MALMTIVVGSVLGAIVGVTLILLRIKDRGDYIPFGPYLALAALLAMLWGEQILRAYLSFGQSLGEGIFMLQGG
jgi:leader peptidase (prepilin peptidase)/N-methyltransferase